MRNCPEGTVTASGTSSHRFPIAARSASRSSTPSVTLPAPGVLAVVNQLQATAREMPPDIAGHWDLVGFTAQQLRPPTPRHGQIASRNHGKNSRDGLVCPSAVDRSGGDRQRFSDQSVQTGPVAITDRGCPNRQDHTNRQPARVPNGLRPSIGRRGVLLRAEAVPGGWAPTCWPLRVWRQSQEGRRRSRHRVRGARVGG
jgi:hypothetical protein